MTQLEAAVERPPHLKAIFPVAVTADLYEGAVHHGLVSSSFITPFLSMVGLTSERSDRFWRSQAIGVARRVLNTPRLHRKFATMNGESAVTMMRQLLKLPHNPHPWDDLWLDVAVKHPTRDEWWEERNLLPLLKGIDIPVYLGCDWQNVPLHLPSTFTAWKALADNPSARMGMLGEFGLTWPWESLHTEALAWFDHWLKGRDTGIMDGPPIRYYLPGADEWRTIGEDVVYRIPLVPNARRFATGHRIRLTLTGDDQDPSTPAIMSFRHASVGTSSLNTVRSSSRLLLPALG
jgi:uncharacterized protein